MQLVKLFLIFSIGCVGLPQKPQVEICVIDYPNNQAFCGKTEKVKTITDLEYQKLVKKITRDLETKPLSYLNHAVSFTPDNWELVSNYIDELKNYAAIYCK